MKANKNSILNINYFQKDLLAWFDQNQRVLPWRDTPSPYRVWISEIMLQQTKVATVIPYFNRFVYEVPNIEELANINQDKLLKLWEGLGYYSRARNLKVAANQMVSLYNGKVPSKKDELEAIKGIGPYTSGAILSIAFNQKYPAVDGNVLRVFSRLYEIKTDIKVAETKKYIKSLVEASLPDEKIGDYNQALMEIGATICLPNGAPECNICPLNKYCKAFKNNTYMEIPLKRKKKAVPKENKTIIILKHKNLYAIEQRDSTGLLASMYQFPLYDRHLTKTDVLKIFQDPLSISKLPNTKHIFSHKEWILKCYLVEVSQKTSHQYVGMEELDNLYSLPKAFNRYKKYL